MGNPRLTERAAQPFALGSLTLRNRIVGAPHGRGLLDDGLALPGDAREPTRPRALSEEEIDAIVEGFRISTVNAARAGFQVVELHAAHRYLLAQFLSPSTNRRPGAARTHIVGRISEAIRRSTSEVVLGIRLSIDGELEGGFTLEGMCELLPAISPLVDYVSVTVGVRTTYARDMATTEPPLLGAIDRLRTVVDRPLLVSQAFRRAESIEAALAAGADLVGVARPLIADPDFPSKVPAGRAEEVRPCVSCNEDCRAFDPVLLCSVNPDLGPSSQGPRPAAPLLARRGAPAPSGARRIAILGAGPAGLECAISTSREHQVVLDNVEIRLGRSPAASCSRVSTGSLRRSGARRSCPTSPASTTRAAHPASSRSDRRRPRVARS